LEEGKRHDARAGLSGETPMNLTHLSLSFNACVVIVTFMVDFGLGAVEVTERIVGSVVDEKETEGAGVVTP